jgi:MATE family multidrug resistance protein
MASALTTLCGQAYGAKQYHMLGVYMQRSCIILFVFAILLLPIYIFATPILKLLGQADDIAELTGSVSIWCIPQHFAFVFMFPIQRYLQSQLKNMVIAWIAAATLVLHIFLSWLFIIKLDMGLLGAAMTLNLAWWVPPIGQFFYISCGGCPQTWTGLSRQAFQDLWPFVKLSVSSGVMLWLVAHFLILKLFLINSNFWLKKV